MTNSAPVAQPDTLSIEEDAGVVIVPVLANDVDVDTNDTKQVISVNATGIRGIAQVVSGGTGVLFYPNNAYGFLRAGQTFQESITYTMADSAGAQSSARLNVTIAGANDAPRAMGNAILVSEDAGPVFFDVLSNDTDIDRGDTKRVISVDGSGVPDSWELVIIYGVGAPIAVPGVPPLRGTATVVPSNQGTVYTVGNAFQHLRSGQSSNDSFRYMMYDGTGAASEAWATVTVTGMDDAPVAVADSLSIAKNAAPATISVLANDTDVDAGDTRRLVSLDTTGLVGTATISADGQSVTYTVGGVLTNLQSHETARDTFRYTMVDSAGLRSTATVTINISGANAAPVAHPDAASASENGQPMTIDVLSNDSDADLGDTKRVVAVNGAGMQGSVSIAPGGTAVVYAVGNGWQTLALGATATETFSYTMQDSGGAQSISQVTVTVTGTNDGPVAVADSATTSEDGVPVVIDVLANDADVDVGDAKTIVSVSGNLQGTATIAADGRSVIYAVGSAFQGLRAGALATETFSYTMADSTGARSTANVVMTIAGVNDSPIAVNNAITITEDAAATTIPVLTNDTDIDSGDTKRVIAVQTAGLLGTVTMAANGSSVTYAAGNMFQYLLTGQTATESFSYTMADSGGAQSQATVTVTITGVTDGPKALADVVNVAEDNGPIVIQVLANDSNDTDVNDNLRVTSINGAGQYSSPILGFFDGAHQLIGISPGFPRMLGQAVISADGRSIIYTPLQSLNAGETGIDKFQYTITGTGGGQSTSVVTIHVTGANDAPQAIADDATAAAGDSPVSIRVFDNDTDPDTRIDPPVPPIPPSPFSEFIVDPTPIDVADTKTIVAINGNGLQGTATIAPGGAQVIYSVGGALAHLPFGTTAVETFTYTMQDRAGAQSVGTVRVTVRGVNHVPVATSDAMQVSEDGSPFTIQALANDSDADAPFGDTKSIVGIQTAGLRGNVTVSADRTALVYSIGSAFQELRAGGSASESFQYTIADSLGAQSTATVTVTVAGTNDGPVAVPNSFSISEDDGPTTMDVLGNDTDADVGDTKTIVSVNPSGLQGSVTIAANGTHLVYTVPSVFQTLLTGQTATETFSYTVADSGGAQSTATVTITILGVNEPVVIVNPPDPSPGSVVGTAGDDMIITAQAADIIFGQAGDDEILAGGGNDTIYGGNDRDDIDGGAGNDIIHGGGDRDDLNGGAGADTFLYYLATESTSIAMDRIRDFRSAEQDKIDLTFIDANTILGGNNNFQFTTAFTRVAGELIVTASGAGVYSVRGDVNGDGIADMVIEVQSAVSLTANDFRL